jgi:hypothetical protein
LVVHRGRGNALRIVANLSATTASIAALELEGRPLLLTTEDVRYGGSRTAILPKELNVVLPHELLVFDAGGGQR